VPKTVIVRRQVPEPSALKCPQCKNKVLSKAGGGSTLRVDGAVRFEEGVCRAKCFFCKTALELPLSLAKSSSAPVARAERLTFPTSKP